jgi:hypothetical protein
VQFLAEAHFAPFFPATEIHNNHIGFTKAGNKMTMGKANDDWRLRATATSKTCEMKPQVYKSCREGLVVPFVG